ncbi:tRNA (5-methylaminomethyl-2-thiouridine)(34)-methyltransferase MnmD [Mucilaginibacter arboris]|uniref:tRNA (5-methylaminomethyl-2-thiouridine)(34)-methyltransferase MnmD n=1 Tax=Mucilaginibacter arboris TaxID=2682090 RepID=A0A7K1SXY2_9SPHI|nr:tRNA (5-methylaminomethyl-2-thiouridine)(34)-methyltransferase MnmD [Mucilaginibacter arboris]MVN22176.1 tRNA (5-methylaminomethyl-2-thiouridine)(34)-methyltransferase MnmD [Mucilaginibacter arboris]
MLQIIQTADGSNTIFNPEIGENYHSKHGAVQESQHVFLKSGLQYFLSVKEASAEIRKDVTVLEVGLGTGLNFLLSADFCTNNQIKLDYVGIEAFPLNTDLIKQTGYEQYISKDLWESFQGMYPSTINHKVKINAFCELELVHRELLNFESPQLFDVVYFDAFAAIHQPEMWGEEAIAHTVSFLKTGGVFVTYAITGNLKRQLKALNFAVEKVPGAPGKREMLRATKL